VELFGDLRNEEELIYIAEEHEEIEPEVSHDGSVEWDRFEGFL
jgi:hypothetical protein